MEYRDIREEYVFTFICFHVLLLPLPTLETGKNPY